jgi:hypothetical protein
VVAAVMACQGASIKGPHDEAFAAAADGIAKVMDCPPFLSRPLSRPLSRHRQGTSHTTRLGPPCSYRTLALLPVLRGLFSLIRFPPPTFASTPHRCCARPTPTR